MYVLSREIYDKLMIIRLFSRHPDSCLNNFWPIQNNMTIVWKHLEDRIVRVQYALYTLDIKICATIWPFLNWKFISMEKIMIHQGQKWSASINEKLTGRSMLNVNGNVMKKIDCSFFVYFCVGSYKRTIRNLKHLRNQLKAVSVKDFRYSYQ